MDSPQVQQQSCPTDREVVDPATPRLPTLMMPQDGEHRLCTLMLRVQITQRRKAQARCVGSRAPGTLDVTAVPARSREISSRPPHPTWGHDAPCPRGSRRPAPTWVTTPRAHVGHDARAHVGSRRPRPRGVTTPRAPRGVTTRACYAARAAQRTSGDLVLEAGQRSLGHPSVPRPPRRQGSTARRRRVRVAAGAVPPHRPSF